MSRLPLSLAVFIASVVLVIPQQSLACSPLLEPLTETQIRGRALEAYAQATAVIDAEVVVPMYMEPDVPEGLIPFAVLEVIGVFKGDIEIGDLVGVVFASTCDVSLETPKQKVRILLTGGAGLLRADQGINGTYLDGPAFDQEIDRLVGHARPKDYTLAIDINEIDS